MTDRTDRLKIRESAKTEDIIQDMFADSYISFARFYLEHSVSDPLLSDEQIYAMWQEKSREK